MPSVQTLGRINGTIVRLDLSDPSCPVLLLDDTGQAEQLARLLLPDGAELDLDWDDAATDRCIVRIPFTSDVDRRIEDFILVLGSAVCAVHRLEVS